MKLGRERLDFLTHAGFWMKDFIAVNTGGPVVGRGGVWK